MKIIHYLIIILLLSSICYATSTNIDDGYFLGYNRSITITIYNDTTIYLALNKYTYLLNLSLILSGDYLGTIFPNQTLYVENPNTYSGSDIDGNVYLNYSKLSYYSNVIWQIKGANSIWNRSIPNDCYNAYSDKIVLRLYSYSDTPGGYASYYCYNFTDWVLLNTTTGCTTFTSSQDAEYTRLIDGDWNTYAFFHPAFPTRWMSDSSQKTCAYIYEEGIYWNFSNYPVNISLDIGEINNLKEYNWSGLFNFTTIIYLNISIINNIFLTNCNCSNCSLNNDTCFIPLYIKANYLSSIQINISNSTTSFGFDNCSNNIFSSNITILNISFYDYEGNTKTIIYNSHAIYNLIKHNGSYNIDSISTYNQKFCKYPAWTNMTVDMQNEYEDNGIYYNYWLYNIILTNQTQQLKLYTASNTTQVLFTVEDDDSDPIVGAYLYILRYDVGTGTYTTKEIIKTDSQGQAIGNINLYNTFYNFQIYYEGNLVYQEQAVKVITTSRTFTVSLLGRSYLDNFDTTLNINYELYYNNQTGNFVFIWSDASGLMHYGCLRVDASSYINKTTLTDTCTYSTAATIVYGITPVNGTTYTATAYIKYDDIITLDQIQEIFAAFNDFFYRTMPKLSLFIGTLWIIVFFLLGIPHPIISLTLQAIGLILAVMLDGLIFIAWIQVGSIIFLILLQIYLYRKRT